MLKQRLNFPLISQKLQLLGLNQSDIASKLGISRESVSKWFSDENFPRPRHLLLFSNLLDLDYENLVIEEYDEFEPVIAYRKAHHTEYTKEEIEKVNEIGYSLEKLLPFINYTKTSITLPNLSNNPDYIRDIVKYIKNKFAINSNVINIEDILKIFNDCDAFVIPVLWGKINSKTKGLHIRLRESNTNWVYINLDSSLFDIKFWMLHELSHLMAPNIEDETLADIFADHFAAEFLFPVEEAEKMYNSFQSLNSEYVLKQLFQKAIELFISPYTIYKQINKHLDSRKLNNLDIPEIVNKFNSSLLPSANKSLTEILLNEKSPEPEKYINLINNVFCKDFIDALVKYSFNEKFSVGFVQSIFNISLLDARALFLVLKARGLKNIGSAY